MKTRLIALTGLFFISLSVQAQDCEAVKAENKRLKAEIASLRYSTKGKTPDGSKLASMVSSGANGFVTQTQTDNDISFKVTSVNGDRKNQTVTVTVLVTNKAANKKAYQTTVKSFTTDEGEEFNLKSALLGNDDSAKMLFTDAPLKTVYVFEGVMPKVSKIKNLPFSYNWYYGETKGQVEFRDLLITWK